MKCYRRSCSGIIREQREADTYQALRDSRMALILILVELTAAGRAVPAAVAHDGKASQIV